MTQPFHSAMEYDRAKIVLKQLEDKQKLFGLSEADKNYILEMNERLKVTDLKKIGHANNRPV